MTIEKQVRQLRYALQAAMTRLEELEASIENTHPTDKPVLTSRASRIQSNFSPLPQNVEWARKEFPDVDLRNETDRFIDYWHAIPGKRGVKLDWQRTWRNWIRKAGEWSKRRGAMSFVDRLNGAADEMDSGDLRKTASEVRSQVDEPVGRRPGAKAGDEGVGHWPLAAKPR